MSSSDLCMLVGSRLVEEEEVLTCFSKVFDAQLNGSPFPVGTGRGPNAAGGFIIDCGVANFGMVGM